MHLWFHMTPACDEAAVRQAGLVDAHLFGLAGTCHGKPGTQESMVSGLRVVEQGYWDASAPGFPFVPHAGDRLPEADALALVAAFRQRPQGLSRNTRRGLG